MFINELQLWGKIFLISTHLNIKELHFHTRVFFFHTFPQIDPFEVIFLHLTCSDPSGSDPKNRL